MVAAGDGMEMSFQNRKQMRINALVGFPLILLLLLIPRLARADFEISAEVSRTEVALRDTFTYEVHISSSSTSAPNPQVEFPSAFRILAGPNSSMNVQLTNGGFSAVRRVSWILQAVQEGEYTIPGPDSTASP